MNRRWAGWGDGIRAGRRARRVVALATLAGALLAGCASTPPAPAPGPTTPAPVTPSVAPSTVPVPTTDPSAGTLATVVTSAAPGAGPAADRAAAESVLRTYLRAVADRDFATACALNAPETNQRLLDELARRGTPAPNCEQAIATLYAGAGVAEGAAAIADTLQVQRVDVTGDAATVAWSVEVSGRRPVVTNALRRVDGQWRLLPTPDPAG